MNVNTALPLTLVQEMPATDSSRDALAMCSMRLLPGQHTRLRGRVHTAVFVCLRAMQ